MIFTDISLKGAFIIEPELMEDDRGFFARSFCDEEFNVHGIDKAIIQCNISYNKLKGTIRGMHYQAAPMAEAKLVRCTMGAIYDVIVDLRPGSPTYCMWLATELNENNRKMLYIPEGFAHGFQTLADSSEVFYQMFERYSPAHARGVRWDDKAFNIKWPLAGPIMSEKDRGYGDFIP